MTLREKIESIDVPYRKLTFASFYVGSGINMIGQWCTWPWIGICYVGALLILVSGVNIGVSLYKGGYKGIGAGMALFILCGSIAYFYLLSLMFAQRIGITSW